MTKPTEELMLTYSKVSADGKSRRAAYLIGDLKRMYTKLPVFNMDQYGMETKEMLPQTGIGSLIEGLQNPKKIGGRQLAGAVPLVLCAGGLERKGARSGKDQQIP